VLDRFTLMYKAVKLEAFYDFAEKHGNMKGNVLKYAIKQPKGSFDIYSQILIWHTAVIWNIRGTRWTDS